MHEYLKDLYKLVPRFLKELDFSYGLNAYTSVVTNVLIMMVLSAILYRVAKYCLVLLMILIARKTKTKFDDLLVSNKTAKYVAQLLPLWFIKHSVPVILTRFDYWEGVFATTVRVYIIILGLYIVKTILKALRDYLKSLKRFSDKPIDSYLQVIMITLTSYGVIMIIMLIFNTKPATLLTTFGAISAIILLIFRDTILGFVASIQVSVNDMVRIGDWITMNKFGADGDVIEINLATVKVRNFDNTTTTIPTYSLISDSFQNWRGMLDSPGRRIKRHILIKSHSIRFLENQDIERMKSIELIKDYLETRSADIQKYNTQKNIDKSILINGRNLTNFGVFRKYITQYLLHYPGIQKDMILLCRQLQPTPNGIPLEIYCFSADKRFENYEYIMADIFDHIFAAVPYFDLELFEFQQTIEPTHT